MGFTPQRRAKLVRLLGEDLVAELEEKTRSDSDRLHDLGIEFKTRRRSREDKSPASWVNDVMGLR